MRVTLSKGDCVLMREPGDKRAQTFHTLLYHARNVLRAQGYDVVKRRMQADGHLMGDETLPYLRERKSRFYIYDGRWQLRDAAEDYREDGSVVLNVQWNGDAATDDAAGEE